MRIPSQSGGGGWKFYKRLCVISCQHCQLIAFFIASSATAKCKLNLVTALSFISACVSFLASIAYWSHSLLLPLPQPNASWLLNRTIRKISVAMIAIELSRISHHGNDLRACSELDSGLLQNWCFCAQILVPTLQVSLRLMHALLTIF